MINIGITGQAGFIGTHIYNTLGLHPDQYTRIPFEDALFEDPNKLAEWVSKCDVIIHLAAMNRHGNPQVIYDTNIRLVEDMIAALDQTNSKAHILFSSSTQEERDNPYGRSKRKGRLLLADWAARAGGGFTGLVIPNVFGPFGNPYYNSVIATFSHQINHGETPKIDIDAEMKLIYVAELAGEIISRIRNHKEKQIIPEFIIPHTASINVTGMLKLLEGFKAEYVVRGIIPALNSPFEINLFNTFRGYMDISNHYPVKFVQHTDDRGAFVEILKLNGGGQFSFSTTKPGITRGNHFHTRKIERFAVIKGNALIQLRKIGTNEVMDFCLSGNEPAYVDMPIWYTHNITNIGKDELFTLFWINEFYNPDDADTFFEEVIRN
ncbi:MAG: NAD-dependent epimerase/dehydratase family protein [Bacteroidetes bacterium]|nr:NAD-dependent epimerase/dehydratase family protein [Bacteroidota bacterium]